MPEISKYEIQLNELTSLEVQVSILVERFNDLIKKNADLENQLNHIKRDNEYLKLQLSSLENDLDTKADSSTIFSASLSLKERESLKQRINEMISKINYHLSSS